jgi:hypothetical protein
MGGICRLCLKESELRNSHILPEFFYLNVYESRDAHRTLEITHEAKRTIQKGLREYLFCQECETKLSRYEGYAAKLIRDISILQRNTAEKYLRLENIDYLNFKLFQLSILWRASIAQGVAFMQVKLGPHEEIIRNMLNDENPGRSADYGCLMMIMLNTEILHQILVSPIRVTQRPFGHTAYKFMTGNIAWLFFVTSHAVNNQVQEFFLQESGSLKIFLASDEKTLLINLAKGFPPLRNLR